MKPALIAVFVLLSVTGARGMTISAAEAKSHVGDTATVEGIVSEVHVSRNGDTFVDIGGYYPNQQFYGVLFAGDVSRVGNLSDLMGQKVAVTGIIQLYRGTPEIVLKSARQIARH